jgi:3,4-dehydroadipyl-CoA semialdehyde dehydrogenase
MLLRGDPNGVSVHHTSFDLESYLGGKWVSGAGNGVALINPSNGQGLARCSTDGLDLAGGLDYARHEGGPALRKLSYGARSKLLAQIADVLTADRGRWFEIARQNSGNTSKDAAIDVDGAIGTLKYFSKIGSALGDGMLLLDGSPIRIARDPDFQSLHMGVPLEGVAVHINAFNFPAWGLWEKAAVSLLAGVPVLAKPATSTAWLAQEMVRKVVEAGILPPGAISILCGPANNLIDHLKAGDLVAFTGSAVTGLTIRRHPGICSHGIRVNIEADSLNATILGQDNLPGSPAFDYFVREAVQEITTKAGQKCTAIRRIIVPSDLADAVADAVSTDLGQVTVGDPRDPAVTMGPLVNAQQLKAVEDGTQELTQEAEIVFQARPASRADAEGCFFGPTLLRAKAGAALRVVNAVEVFGPVATIVPYRTASEGFSVAKAGGGSLVASVFSADPAFLRAAARAIGSDHGRLLLVDPSICDKHTGHGIVMPSCIHGGPGRAGGGEELGALRGLWFYHQRVAIQGSRSTLDDIAINGAQPAAF